MPANVVRRRTDGRAPGLPARHPLAHEHTRRVCIVMHMTRKRVAVAGASGYAGGEVLRLLLGHPGVEIGALTGGSNAGETARRPPAAPGAAGRPGARADRRSRSSPGTTWSSSACRTASPARSPAQLGDDVAGDRLRRRLPARPTPAAWEQFYGGDHAGTWPYGLPELPGPARAAARRHAGSPSPAATRPSPPSRSPRPSPPAWSSPTSSWSPRPAPAAPARRPSRTCSAAR